MQKDIIPIEEMKSRLKQAVKSIEFSSQEIEEDKATSEFRENKSIIPNINDKRRQLDTEINNVNLRWNILTDRLITSHRKMFGRFIVMGKRIVRKTLRWYINPLFDQQREFNGSVTRSLNILGEIIDQQNYGLNKQIADYELLTKQNDVLQQQLSIYKDMVLDQKESYKKQLTLLTNASIELGKTLVYMYADKDTEIALALAVEINRITGKQEFMDIIEKLNKRLVIKELHS